ncbi:MAG TPA: CPBP family intramembrane glutamic endopeptidase [Ktedonobacteraceae bacterium]
MNISSSTHPVVSAPGSLRSFMQRYPLICYFVMAYGFSWLAWLPYVFSQSGLGLLPVTLSQAAVLPGAYLGPLLSGFLMTAAVEGRPGVQRLLRRIILWRVGWQWYLFALLGVPAILILSFFTRPGSVAALHFSAFPQLALFFPLLLIVEILTSGLAEEPGWRGFALPRLQERYGPLLGSLMLGLLWGGWHLPLFLTNWAVNSGGLAIGEFLLSTILIAIVITWVFNHTRGSLLIAILLHATLDAFSSAVAASGLFTLQWFQRNAIADLLIGVGVAVLVLIALTRGRLGYGRASSSSATIAGQYDEHA